MPKNQKSSASTATRKKHARKAATTAGEQLLPLPKEKGNKDKGKGKSKEPRQKAYIPPTKPTPIQLDPLDSLGLAKELPPEFVIVLRRLAKKDSVTKRKALEELHVDWVQKVLARAENAQAIEAYFLTALPVWLHHIPYLFIHSSRRVRVSATTLHLALLQIPSFLKQMSYVLHETAFSDVVQSIIGSWCIAVHDVDKQVAVQARRAWNLAIATTSEVSRSDLVYLLEDQTLDHLADFAGRCLFDPQKIYLDLNPILRAQNVEGALNGQGTQPADEDTTFRAKQEEEESDDDRKSRIRVSAMGILKWFLELKTAGLPSRLTELLNTPLLWTVLFHDSSASFYPVSLPLGFGQPSVRRAAWLTFHILIKNWKSETKSLLPIMSSAILRSAWNEPDSFVRESIWEPLLMFLTQYPQAWEIDLNRPLIAVQNGSRESRRHVKGDSDESSSDEDEDDATGEPSLAGQPHESHAYSDFLRFLKSGCGGSPMNGYPTVVIVLSTIPPLILGARELSWESFFSSFWAALDDRSLSSLDRSKASAAFLSSLLECLIFLIKRWKAAKYPSDIASSFVQAIIKNQIGHIWDDLGNRRLRVDGFTVGKIFARTLQSLFSVEIELYDIAWNSLENSIREAFISEDAMRSDLVMHILKACNEQLRDGSETKTRLLNLITGTAAMVVDKIDVLLSKSEANALQNDLGILEQFISNFDEILFIDTDLTLRLDRLMFDNIRHLLIETPSVLVIFLRHRRDPRLQSSLWSKVLSVLASERSVGEHVLRIMLLAVEQNQLPGDLHPEDDELDALVIELVARLLNDCDTEILSTVRGLLQHPARFLCRRSVDSILHHIIYTFSEKVRLLLHDSTVVKDPLELHIPLDLLNSVLTVRPEVTYSEDMCLFLPDIFIFGSIFPHSNVSIDALDEAFALARLVWSTCISRLQNTEREGVYYSLKRSLRDIISDVDSRLTPLTVLGIIERCDFGQKFDILDDFLPSKDQYDDMLCAVPLNPLDSCLAIVDPLVPPKLLWKEENFPSPFFDSTGLSEYARLVNALLHVLTNERQKARENLWAMRHFIILANTINSVLKLPDVENCIASKFASRSTLEDMVTRVQKLTALLLSAPSSDQWHSVITQKNHRLLDFLGEFVRSVLEISETTDSYRDSLTLHTVLRHILSGATRVDADSWLSLARKMEKQAPQTALAIVQSVTSNAPETSRLERYRNELAADALGVIESEIESTGLSLLRRLAATAPEVDSDIAFLPQLRAVNLMKACQQWILSDEGISDVVQSQLTVLLLHIAPILQNVSGSHWDLVFDLIENNLDDRSFNESDSLVIIYRTCKLLLHIKDLVSTNKLLRALWNERESPILTQVKDMVTKSEVSSRRSVPQALCWETALLVIQELPPTLIDHNTLPNMCHLLLDKSLMVQQMAFRIIRPATRRFTEHVVVEAAVDTSENIIDLPVELLELLRKAFDRDDSQENDNILAYFLGWLIIFDLFEGSSLRVKVAYLRHLRELAIVENQLIPTLLHFINLQSDDSKTFRLDSWKLDEYYIEYFEPELSLSLKLLAAHLFYRALLNVRTLVTDWWRQCKDRQLSMTVANITARNFSPVLVAAEFAHFKDPDIMAELKDENWDVKVASAISEVSLTFNFDEQQMEIRIKIPPDYPLHYAEIRDVSRVGVEEQRWRGWILAVQQVLTGQSGRIVDGLSLFKKNVTAFFKDRVECAICYSVVSPMDMSLPKKRCKTCRNQFHAGCLYKWFNTSHSSSCPLCRSDFL